MSSDRRKPRHPPEVPGGGTEIVRELHEKIQEGYYLIRTLRALMTETRRASAQLDEALTRFGKATSEENITELLEPPVSGVVDRIIKVGELATKTLEEREERLIEVITEAAGIESVPELTKAIAALICDQVLEAIWTIKQDGNSQAKAVDRLVELVPDLTETLGRIGNPVPLPPEVKRGPRPRSRNRRRRG